MQHDKAETPNRFPLILILGAVYEEVDYLKELISKPEIFNYGKLGKIRGLVVSKEPWFVAKDVCDVLEIKNVA